MVRWGRRGALSRKNGLSQGLDWDLRGRIPGVVGRNSGEGKTAGRRSWGPGKPRLVSNGVFRMQDVQTYHFSPSKAK